MPHKAFFLDRDGTLNVDYNFVHTPEEWTWRKGAIEAIQWMNRNHFKVIVVTNQSGIARGRYKVDDVLHLHNWVDEQLKQHDAWIDDWYIAPHHPEHDTDPPSFKPSHRKPGTGMFEAAADKHDIDISQSCMAGDKETDLQPALELGIQCFHISSRHPTEPHADFLKKHNIPSFDHLGEVINHLSN